MIETNSKPTVSELCTIRIAFPVSSDEEAIDFKKKITEVLLSIPTAQIDFHLITAPPK